MDMDELIDYLYLRAEECGYPEDILKEISLRLKELEIKDLDNLRRISEPAFRGWCVKKENENG